MAEGLDATGELTEVSKGGLFIRAEELPRPGAVVALQFWTPAGDLVDLRGEARWNTQGLVNGQAPAGFGVLLREPPNGYREFFIWTQQQDLWAQQREDEKEEEADPEEL